VARRTFARRGFVKEKQLLALLDKTAVSAEVRERIRSAIASDFAAPQLERGAARTQIVSG
jgi:hypothetical protein